MVEKLLSRIEFRENTLARLNGRCVIPGCSEKAADAHHILNRRLFEDDSLGGYFLSNGAPLCSVHHYAAEITSLSVENLRKFCDIENPTLPVDFNPDAKYDTWGNRYREDGLRERGPLFLDDGFQKIFKKTNLAYLFVA